VDEELKKNTWNVVPRFWVGNTSASLQHPRHLNPMSVASMAPFPPFSGSAGTCMYQGLETRSTDELHAVHFGTLAGWMVFCQVTRNIFRSRRINLLTNPSL